MGVNKRIKVGNSDIGTSGSAGGATGSSEGGQFPFLPSCDSYSNANLGKKGVKSGTNNQSSQYNFPFLPKGNPSGIRGGKK